MSQMLQIHIVDGDTRRRAQLAFRLSGSGYRAHVYEDIDELERFEPSQGLVLLSAHDDPHALCKLRHKQEARGVSIPIALYASEPKAPHVVEAMLSGAVDYLQWPLVEEGILDRVAIRAVQQQKIERRRIAALEAVGALSDREREVLVALIAGGSTKIIAQQLKISPRTVEVHRGNLIKKLRVESTASAVRVGIYAGLDGANLKQSIDVTDESGEPTRDDQLLQG